MSIRHICKSKFHVCYHSPFFLDMKIPEVKNLLTLPVSSILMELLGIFIFTLLCGASKRFYVFSLLTQDWDIKGFKTVFVELPT